MKSFNSYTIISPILSSLFCDYVMKRMRARATELPQLIKNPGSAVCSNGNNLELFSLFRLWFPRGGVKLVSEGFSPKNRDKVSVYIYEFS